MDISLIALARIDFYLALKQFLWIILGFCLSIYFLPMFFDFISKFKWSSVFCVLTGMLLLGLNFVFGHKINGANNWLNLYRASFQPSEILKFFYVFYLASALEKPKHFFIIPTFFSFLLIIILILQRDLGTALIFFIMFVSQIYLITGKKKIFLCALFLILSGFISGYFIFPHIKTRIISWLNPWENIDNQGYQITQALFSIASGNIFGSGLTLGLAAKYVPIIESDFIFVSLCEEFGNIFSTEIIFVYVLILFCVFKIMTLSNNKFYFLVLNLVMSLLGFQTLLILGGCIKLIPFTGVTLPFVSYGGTSLVTNILLSSSMIFVYKKFETQKEISTSSGIAHEKL